MAPIRLPCLVGGDCNFQTVQLEYEQAKAQQDGHMQYAHGATAGAGVGKKPEKFPRPEIKMDSSAEDWSEFEVEWEQYKEEYTLAGSALIRQLYACCSDELKQSLSRSTGGRQFIQTEANLLKLIKQLKMQDRAKHSVFWPGITSDIEQTRKNCSFCERNAPSQPAMPPLPLTSPQYPFQMIVADYFDVKGKSWLVIADRFSGWLSLHYYPREASSSDLIKSLK